MNQLARPKQIFFISLRWILLISFTLLFTVVLATIFYWFYTFATNQAMDRIKVDLEKAVEVVKLELNQAELLALAKDGQPNAAGVAWRAAQEGGDKEKQTALSKYGPPNTAGFSDDPRYQRLLDWLDTVHRIEPRAWPYLWVNGETEEEIIYVVDLAARYNPAKATLFRDHQSETSWVTKLEFSVDDKGIFAPYTDPWGSWVSAWTPVKNANGELIGGIGIDFEAAYVEQMQQTLRDRVVLAFAITYAILFVMVFVISRTLTQRIITLTRLAELIGEGHYDQDLSSWRGGRFHDEIDILAQVFSVMVNKVYQREQALRHQVQELRIEIDEVKRKKQVSEIVDSDFFRELENKARQIRRRKQKNEPGDETSEL